MKDALGKTFYKKFQVFTPCPAMLALRPRIVAAASAATRFIVMTMVFVMMAVFMARLRAMSAPLMIITMPALVIMSAAAVMTIMFMVAAITAPRHELAGQQFFQQPTELLLFPTVQAAEPLVPEFSLLRFHLFSSFPAGLGKKYIGLPFIIVIYALFHQPVTLQALYNLAYGSGPQSQGFHQLFLAGAIHDFQFTQYSALAAMHARRAALMVLSTPAHTHAVMQGHRAKAKLFRKFSLYIFFHLTDLYH